MERRSGARFVDLMFPTTHLGQWLVGGLPGNVVIFRGWTSINSRRTSISSLKTCISSCITMRFPDLFLSSLVAEKHSMIGIWSRCLSIQSGINIGKLAPFWPHTLCQAVRLLSGKPQPQNQPYFQRYVYNLPPNNCWYIDTWNFRYLKRTTRVSLLQSFPHLFSATILSEIRSFNLARCGTL